MLKALKAQLIQLSEKSEESIAKRFKRFATYEKARTYEQDLKNFVLCLPDLLQQNRVWFESEEIPSHLRKVYWYLLTYVYHSTDLLPEEDYGFWGYLDDAYLIGLAYSKTLNDYHIPASTHLADKFDQQIESWLQKTQEILPQQTEALDALFGKLLLGEHEAFNKTLLACAPAS